LASFNIILAQSAIAAVGFVWYILFPFYIRRTMKMNKKIILITGASSGMGKITAEELIKEGHIVYGAARNADRMKDLEKLGGKTITMDVSDRKSIEDGIAKIIQEQGKIDVLWNNAGYGLYGPVEEVKIEDARYQFDVNLFGLAELTQLVLPYMRKQKSGLILNTSSMGGKIYTPLGAWYHATKHALEGWSDCLRLELKEFGINVVVLEPGLIETGFSAGVQHHFPEESVKGPYKKIVQALLNAQASGSMKGSDPMVIARTVKKIINAKNPKTRYLVGKLAKPLLFIRRWFGDRVYDKAIMSQVK
jgi:short-subunit dehydrogenase